MAEFRGLHYSTTIRPREPVARLSVLAAGAIVRGVEAFARLAQREAGIALEPQFGNGTRIVRRLEAGESFDVLIAAPSAIEAASKLGRLVAGTIAPVGRVDIGAFVAASSPLPDVSTTEALRQAILAADEVVYNTATSGTRVDEMLAEIGVRDAMAAKIVRGPGGPSVMQRVARARVSGLGFGAITEILASRSLGLKLAGALPGELRPYVAYSAAIMTGPNDALGRKLLDLIASPAGKAAFARAGVE